MTRRNFMCRNTGFTPSHPVSKERIMTRTVPSLAALAVAGLALSPLAVHAVPVTWVGDVDSNWSTDVGPGDTNWDTNTLPGASDTAIFNDAPGGVSTIVDAVTSLQFLQINQSTTSATNAISLAADLFINDTANTSSITYGSTISNAAMINWDLNGNTLFLSRNANTGNFNNLYGTFTLDTAGSRIGTDRQFGTGNSDVLTMNFGSGSNLAVINATADATIGVFRTATTTDRQDDPSTINIGVGSEVNVSNNALLNFLYANRSDSVTGGAQILTVNNAGTVDVAAGSTVAVEYNQINNSNKTINIGLTNQSGGLVQHKGMVKMDLHERGTATIRNAGLWRAHAGAIILGELDSDGTGDGGTIVFTNQSGGVLTNASSGSLDYNTSETLLNSVLTLTNQGIISPGDQHNGSGLASVGTFSMTDIDVTFSGTDATLRIDLGGLTAGSQHDVLTLTNGVLTLDADSNLDLFYVNGFNGTAGDSWTILNYGSAVTTGFDLASALNITGASGFAANPANYQIEFNATSATLSLIPEPGTLTLAAAGLAMVAYRRRNA